jgi:hypothetical protein
MRVIRAAAEADELPDEEVRYLMQQRITMLSEDESYDPAIHGYFIVIEAHDSTDAVNPYLGFSVMCTRRGWTSPTFSI